MLSSAAVHVYSFEFALLQPSTMAQCSLSVINKQFAVKKEKEKRKHS